MKTIIHQCTLLALVGLLATARPVSGAWIYDNSVNDLLVRFQLYAGAEYGDEIILAGPERYLTHFSFEFWGLNTENPHFYSGSPEAKVRFYLNDGPLYHGYPTPGSKFYESDWFSIGPPTERATANFGLSDFGGSPLFMPVASNFTWTVEFRNMGATDQVGVDIYSPPVIGQSYPDYWENAGGGWMLKTNIVPMDFACRFEAIPEPTSLMLVGFGGLVALAFASGLFRRR